MPLRINYEIIQVQNKRQQRSTLKSTNRSLVKNADSARSSAQNAQRPATIEGRESENTDNQRSTNSGEDSEEEEYTEKIIRNLGNIVSQRVAIEDLRQNPELYEKYLNKKIKFRNLKLRWIRFRNSVLRSNSVTYAKLNNAELYLTRFMLVTIFLLSWILMVQMFTVALYHTKLKTKISFWVMIMCPHFLTPIYILICNVSYVRVNLTGLICQILTLKSRYLKRIQRINIQSQVTVILLSLLNLDLFFADASDWGTLLLPYQLALAFLIQNYFVSVIEGTQKQRLCLSNIQ